MSKKQIIHVDEKPHMKTNVIMLPIDINTVQPEDCVGFIFKNENGVVNILNNLDDIIKSNAYFKAIPQHLYIISDEEIKEGDWYYESEFQLILKKEGKGILKAKKIIATTDTSLICEQERFLKGYKSELPKPSQQFIEKYIEEYNKGNVITEVLVEVEETYIDPIGNKSDCKLDDTEINYHLKLDSQNIITIRKQKDSWSREELPIDAMITLRNSLNTPIFKRKFMGGVMFDAVKELDKWIEENL